MRKRPWLGVLPVVLISAVLAAPVAADLSVFVGQVGFDDEANLETAPAFGMIGTLIGLVQMIARPERDLGVTEGTATAIFYEGRVLISIPAGQLNPFIGVGFGAITTTSADVPSDREEAVKEALGAAADLQNNPALSYGGGIRYALGDRLGVRVDIRQYQVFSVAGVVAAAVEEAVGEDLSEDHTVQYNELSMGVVFSF